MWVSLASVAFLKQSAGALVDTRSCSRCAFWSGVEGISELCGPTMGRCVRSKNWFPRALTAGFPSLCLWRELSESHMAVFGVRACLTDCGNRSVCTLPEPWHWCRPGVEV